MLKLAIQHFLAAFKSTSKPDNSMSLSSSTTFVARLTTFVVVGVLSGFLVGNVQVVQAQGIDSGITCGTTADCNSSNPAVQCINNTCQVTQQSIQEATKIKQTTDLNEGNSSSSPNLFNFTDTYYNALLASTAKSLGGCGALGTCVDYDGDLVSSTGIFGGLKDTMVAMYQHKPADTQTYIADLFDSAGVTIAEPAYAQGIGFSALDPILETWKIFRNLAFLFFTIIFLAIGFMIMFRQKLGQSAVTAQQAIPQIIVSLLVVSFSYAIAGLLIDAMYLLMYLLVGVFGQESSLIDLNFFTLGIKLMTNSFETINAIGEFVDSSLGSLTAVITESIEFFTEIAFVLIIFVAILIGMFRLFFELLKTYVSIIIAIALSPLILMMGAIPGRNAFAAWFQSLVGNLAAFPTVLVVLIIFDMLTASPVVGDAGFIPPYLMGSGSGGVIPTLVGLGLILALPEIVVKVKEALGAKDSFGWITSAAFKNLQRGQIALPYAGGAAGGVLNTARVAPGILRSADSPAEKRRDLQQAASKGAYSGFKGGQTIQKWYQRAKEGRIGQVEDVEKLLSQLANKNGDSKK